MAENFDVKDRGSFYDKTGAIRDVVQNHLLQVLATVLADPPDGRGLGSWRESKSQMIAALRPLTRPTSSRASTTVTATWRAWTRNRPRRPTWPCGWTPTPGAGPTCRSDPGGQVPAGDRHRGDVPASAAAARHLRARRGGRRQRAELPDPPRDQVRLTLIGKKPGGGWQPQPEGLQFSEQPGTDMRPTTGYRCRAERRALAVRRGRTRSRRRGGSSTRWSATSVPVLPYARGTWGPAEADRLLPPGATWHCPGGTES